MLTLPGIPSPGAILAVVLALIAAAGGGYWRGFVAADRSAQIERLEGEAARYKQTIAGRDLTIGELNRRINAVHQIAGEAALRERESATLATELQGMVNDYARALQEAAQAEQPSVCTLRDADVDALNRMRHARPSGTDPGPTVPSGRAGDVR